MSYQQILDDLVFAWLIVMYEDKQEVTSHEDIKNTNFWLNNGNIEL